MRVIVCGSRRWTDREHIADRLYDLPPNDETVVVHGGAHGADRIAGQEAAKLGLRVEVVRAEWEKYGKRAGYVRNELMVSLGADLCIAFWDGLSKGTAHTIGLAKAVDIPVEIIFKEGTHE